MADIICLHDMTQGPWCWKKTIPHFTALGHEIHTPKLECISTDRDAGTQKHRSNISLQSSLRRVCDIVANIGPKPIIFLGHGVGAFIALQSQRFFDAPQSAIISLAGLLPRNGESVCNLARAMNLNPSDERRWIEKEYRVSINSELLIKKLYHDSGLEDVRLARRSLGSANRQVLSKTMNLHSAKVDSLKLAYIFCTRDRMLPISGQYLMAERYNITHTRHLECGHAAFFRYPKALARLVDELAKTLIDAPPPTSPKTG